MLCVYGFVCRRYSLSPFLCNRSVLQFNLILSLGFQLSPSELMNFYCVTKHPQTSYLAQDAVAHLGSSTGLVRLGSTLLASLMHLWFLADPVGDLGFLS